MVLSTYKILTIKILYLVAMNKTIPTPVTSFGLKTNTTIVYRLHLNFIIILISLKTTMKRTRLTTV